MHTLRNDCRLCHGPIHKVLELKDTALANEFVKSPFEKQGEFDLTAIKQEVFPLGLWKCEKCCHLQLPIVVDPNRLFSNYVYVAGTSPVFVKHFEEYSKTCIDLASLTADDFVIDIGSNDGTLLKFFKKHGVKVLGIDPAIDISKKANEEGIETLNHFFTYSLSEIIKNKYGKAKLITANNVFAHADDLSDILSGVTNLLTDDGVFIFEVSYLVDVINNNLFDTIYHEHLSYHHLYPLLNFIERYHLRIFDAHRVNTHGGSIRVYCRFNQPSSLSSSLKQLLDQEYELGLCPHSDPLNGYDAIAGLNYKINKLSQDLKSYLLQEKIDGSLIAGFGAPAKATTLMYQFGFDKDLISFIIDDSPLKQGLYSPGLHIPVVPSSWLYEKKPDVVVILAWNFAESIIKNHRRYLDEGGIFIIPIPEFKIISNMVD